MKYPRLIPLSLAASLATGSWLLAAPGSLDPTFGVGGKAVTQLATVATEGSYATCSELQNDGKIVVGGYVYDGTGVRLAVARYDAAGALDPSFNGTGSRSIAVGGAGKFSQAVGVAAQGDRKVVVVGSSSDSTSGDVVVLRFLENGTLDPGFNSNGIVTTTVGGSSYGNAVKVQSDGKIVVAGSSDDDLLLLRYKSDGTPDPDFGVGGRLLVPFSHYGIAYGVVIQADGKIAAAGVADGDIAVVRCKADGTLDPTFGGGTGKVTTRTGDRGSVANSVAVQGDGKIVVAGEVAYIGKNNQFALLRYNPDGSLDGSFNGTGKVTVASNGVDDAFNAVAVQGDGRIVAAGISYNGPGRNARIALMRFNPNGTFDTSFVGAGKVFTPVGKSAGGQSIDLQADGKIVVGGFSADGVGGRGAFAVVRYLGGLGLAPATGSALGNPAAISFTLAEAARAGSVKLTFVGAVTRVLVLAGSQEAPGAHSFSFDPANPTASPEIASGSALPDGIYRVVLSYQDAAGHLLTSTASTKVTLDTVTRTPMLALPAAETSTGSPVSVDFTLPEEALPGSVQLTFAGATTRVLTLAAAQESAGAHTFIFDPADPTASPAIASGNPLPDGPYDVTLTFQDALGNPPSVATHANVVLTSTPSETFLLARKGSVVPSAGLDLRIPLGVTSGAFGDPSITMGGTRVGWRATVLPLPAGQAWNGIFAGPPEAPTLLLKTGDEVPDEFADALEGVRFTNIREPVFAGGDFAVGATIAGPRVLAGVNNTGIWLASGGALRQLARAGGAAPGAGAAKFRAFTYVAMPAAGTVFFTATLTAPAAMDAGLWARGNSGLKLLLREGDPVDVGAGPENLVAFKALIPATGSPGHARYDASIPAVDVVLTLPNKRTAIGTVDADGNLSVARVTGIADPQGRVATSFGIPSSPGGGAGPIVLATLAANPALGISAASNAAILDSDAATILAQKGDPAPDAGTAKFSILRDPVAGTGVGGVRVAAFAANLSGASAANDTGLWAHTPGSGLALVAREGGTAPGAGGKWAAFLSLAVLDGRGPAFTAKLLRAAPAVTAANDTGLWATDSTGTLRMILRTGDLVLGKKLKSFNVLGAVSGSPGQRRAWAGADPSAKVIYRATLTDSAGATTTAIVGVRVP